MRLIHAAIPALMLTGLAGALIAQPGKPDPAAITGGSYTVQVTNGSGCTATSAPTLVTVNPTPSTPTVTASGPITFCSGGSVTLTSSSPSGNTWTPGGQTTQSITVSVAGTYAVSVTQAGCASGSSAPVIMRNSVVLPAPFGPMTPTIPPGGSLNERSSISSLS